MTPKDILLSAFEKLISPGLEELGFKYTRSSFAYSRKINGFTQRISIRLSTRNTQEGMRFSSAFNVASPAYNKWLRQHAREGFDGYLGGCTDWNIPGWPVESDNSVSFDFTRPDRRPAVLEDWFHRCVSVGIPYLNKLSSWEGLATELLRWKWQWDRAADYFVMSGDTKMAIQALEKGIEILAAQEFPYPEDAHPILGKKKQRQAENRDLEIASFQKRILELKSGD